jgi:hypothetical protein
MQYIVFGDINYVQRHPASVPESIEFQGVHYISKCGRCYGDGGYDFYLYMLPSTTKWPHNDIALLDATVLAYSGLKRTNPEPGD